MHLQHATTLSETMSLAEQEVRSWLRNVQSTVEAATAQVAHLGGSLADQQRLVSASNQHIQTGSLLTQTNNKLTQASNEASPVWDRSALGKC